MSGPDSEALTRPLVADRGGPVRHEAEPSVIARIRGAVFDGVATSTKIGRYSLLDEIGRGGLGIVYAAFDPQLDRRVALKIVRPDRRDSDGAHRQRLLQEARALARLTHPNVVYVHDAGVHEDCVFVAMELVPGQTLSAWVRERAPDWQTLRDMLVQAGRGLAAAHRAGVVHRDFKPANVLVDREERVRVVDFGLARTADIELGDAAASTSADDLAMHSGTLMGTPVYMAPEQFEGAISAASDQWSFCVTAYELFYGERPFAGATFDELRATIEAGVEPEPALARGVPGWMLRTLRRGLRVDPRERHAGMAALLDAMQADRVLRRKRVRLAVALAAALALGGATAAVIAGADDPQTEADIATLEQQARDAADVGAFIYPPIDDPTRATAYSTVLTLEAIDSTHARARAETLRTEFADELAATGDKYWETDGGRGFASDFYAAALLFSPSRTDLRERSAITLGELAELRRRAEAGGFTEAELQGGAVLSALAEPDPALRTAKLDEVTASADALPTGVRVDVERVLGRRSRRQEARARAHGEPDQREAPSDRTRSVDAAPPTTRESAAPTPAAAPVPPAAVGNADAARRAVADGRARLRAGEYAAAETAFHRALEANPRSHEALFGLSEASFNRAAHQQALSYARRAVALAPRRGDYRMQLGDAYFKVLRYDDARREYEAASKRGHPGAEAALARLRTRLGEAR